jgi:LPXTG-site transpeptidase (sortase) family protein
MIYSVNTPLSKILQVFIVIALLIALGIPAPAQAAGELTVTPITWNVVGLDSNDTSAGPNLFPVGVRVCNATSATITNITPSFAWATDATSAANASFIYLRPGSYGTSIPYPTIPTLAAGACTDVYYEVEINRNQVGGVYAYDKTRRYTISVSGTYNSGTVTATSPAPREIYVEHLISQNRNATFSVELDSGSGFVPVPAGGTMALMVGNTYNIKLIGNTATQGYEQIESFINFDNTIFKINHISTTYTADAGTDNTPPYQASTKLYADGCTWVNDPNSPLYRSCLSTGKYGGTVTTTYNVTIVSGAGVTETLKSLIYDFSGSSYHYNADTTAAARIVTIIGAPDPSAVTVAKSFVPATITPGGTSTLAITINNPNASSVSGVSISDNLPSGMTVNSPLVSSLTGCGTGSLSGTGGSTVNFSGGTIAANSSCVIKVAVSATSTQTNTTNHLFVGGVDQNKTASATLTVSSTVGACATGVTLAAWSIPSTSRPPDNGAGVPSTLYTGVTATAAENGLTSPAITTETISPFAATYWWSSRGFNTTSATAANSFGFTLNAASQTFSNLTLSFNTGRPSSVAASNYSIFASTNPTVALASGTIALNGQPHSVTLTGSFPSGTTFYIAPYGANNNGVNSTLYVDEITFTGDVCGTPGPTLSKSFGSDPILVNGTSALTFEVKNQQTGNVALSGVSFTDVLPVGLTVASGSVSGTCSAGSSGTLTVTAPRTISLSGGTMAQGGSCTFVVNVTGAAAGDYENVSGYISSTQTGTSTAGANVGYAYDTLAVIAPPVVLKSFDDTAIFNAAPDNTANLTITITNPNPSIALTGLAFVDSLPSGLVATTPTTVTNPCGTGSSLTIASGSITLAGGQLAAGASCSVTVNVTGTSAGLKTNTVQVSSTNGGTSNTSSANITVMARTAALEVNKQISLSASGPWTKYVAVTPGQTVYYRFTVDNTGDLPISDVKVKNLSDDSVECTIAGPIAVGSSATCTASATATSPLRTNTVYATSDADTVTSKPQTSSATYATSAISLLKSATQPNFTVAGQVLNYSYLVTNTGEASLYGPVTVADDKTTVTCPALTTIGDLDDWFDKGESLTCSATYTVQAADMTAGSITNTAKATVSAVDSNTSSVTLNKLQGTLVIDKVTVPAGDTTSFDFVATGSGNADFSLADADTPHSVTLDQGTYTVSESAVTNWDITNIACVVSGTHGSTVTIGSDSDFDTGDSSISVDLKAGDTVTCTYTNGAWPVLHVVKDLTNDNGGTLTIPDFSFSVNGGSATAFESDGQNDLILAPATYTVTETAVSGYFSSTSGCDLVALDYGDEATCTITNDDLAPKLHLRKTVTNDNAGSALNTAWTLTATGTAATPTNLSGTTPVDSGSGFLSDTYTLAETGGPAGYTAGNWSCVVTGTSTPVTVSNSQVTLGLGEDVTCTINNNDDAPSLTLLKTVTNNNGGTAVASAWTLTATGALASPTNLSGTSGVTSGTTFKADTYTLGESGGPSGYAAGSWSCVKNGNPAVTGNTITLASGDTATCTINNNDIAPSLTLTNSVTNNDGGSASATDWTLTATGPTTITGTTPVSSGTGFAAGTYTLSQTGGPASGYTTGTWNCTGGTFVAPDQITLALGETASCSIANDDVAPTLKLVKVVTNDDGGSGVPADWTLTASGTSRGFSDSGDSTTFHTMMAGVVYTLSEDDLPGYTAGSWSCDTGSLSGDELTLALGEDATCTITNDDIGATLTLLKTVTNNNGGTLTAVDFPVFVDSDAAVWGTPINLSAGTYTVSETTQTGYAADTWGGDCAADGSVTLEVGDDKTCTITNDDIAPKLTVSVVVNNNYGGTALPDDFSPSVGGTVVTSGVASTLLSNTPYAIDETLVTGYEFVSISGDAKCPALLAGTITLAPGDDITCTITNADIAPQLTVVKTVSNTHGGTLGASDFTMNVTGTDVSDDSFAGSASGVTVTLDAGAYSVDEDAVSGYTQVSASADCSGTIAIGESKTCTIANADVAPQLTVIKHVVNDDGGSLAAGDFTMSVTGTNVSDDSFAGSESGVTITLDAGAYSVSEGAVTGYAQVSASADCSGTIAIGESKTCTITNDDQTGTLVVKKIVVNDNGGSASADDFQFQVNSGSAVTFEADGENSLSVSAGTYSVTEVSDSHYAASYSNCTNVTVANGETKTCTITNNDVAPSLTLKATVTNNYGGSALATDWTLTASGPTPLSGTTDVVSGASFLAGNYTLGFNSGPAGYSNGGWSCTVNGSPVAYSSSLTLGLADVAVCEIAFADIQPTLTLTKTVDNSSGQHSLTQDDFPAFITGTLTTPANWDTAYGLNAGSYIASETSQSGYLAGNWGGDCAADGSVTLAIGDAKTCTITNTAEDPVISLDKDGSLDMTVVDPATIVNAGDVIDYTFSVDAAASNVPLHDVHVTDAACDSTPVYDSGDDGDNILQTSETWVFTCSHTVTQAEIESGSFVNNATAYGTSPFDLEVNDSDTTTTDFTAEYILLVEKTSTTTSITAADIVIPYTITLFNGGNMPVSNIVVDDAKCNADLAYQSGDDNNDDILQVEEEWIYTCTYRVTQADIDLGLDVTNKVIVKADRIDPQAEDTLDIPVVQGAAIELTKSGSLDMTVVAPDAQANPGDTITYTFSVENIGNVTLWGDITVTDPMLPSLSCTIAVSDNTLFPSGFEPGASAECTATGNVYTLIADDISAGSVVNTATAATTYEDDPVTDDDEATTETIPVREITLEKEANVATFAAASEVITYTYTITNTGNLDLYPEYTVVDDKLAVVTCPDLPDTLVPGGSVVCSGDYTVTANDVTAGSVVNNATAFANTTADCSADCVLVQASDQATVPGTTPEPEDTSATAALAFLPETGFVPNQQTILSGVPETYSSTELTISIPALNVMTNITGVPHRNGTYAIDWLGNEVGWLEGSAYPGSIGNSILTAHNFLANGRPGPFVDLKTLKWGDQVIVEQGGRSYIYEVRSVMRVRPEDLSSLGHKDYGYLTLITCLGYDAQSESYLYRTIVQAVLVDVR